MTVRQSRKKKQRRRIQVIFTLTFLILLLFIALLFFLFFNIQKKKPEWFDLHYGKTTETEMAEIQTEPVLPETEAPAETESETEKDDTLTEEDIYTFLQGPKAWKSRTDWSGTWNSVVYADQEFSVFGCGLCVMANIYSTLTPYDCSPLDMLDFAEEVTDYHPVSGFGAIDWRYMMQTLKATGIHSVLRKKDKTYEKFRDAIAGGLTAVVLVSSGNDDTYWHDVEGHYVNIWLYDSEDDTVFLADSGNPEHNRQRIPLKYIYDALKTADKYQYLLVRSADPEANNWKHDGINIRWKKPRYYNAMRKRLSE